MKILFATDGAKQSDAAIEMLRNLALSDGDEVKVVSVVDMAVPMAIDIYGGYIPDTGELEKTARENAEKLLERTAERIASLFEGKTLTISTEVLFGSPESRIVETAEEYETVKQLGVHLVQGFYLHPPAPEPATPAVA